MKRIFLTGFLSLFLGLCNAQEIKVGAGEVYSPFGDLVKRVFPEAFRTHSHGHSRNEIASQEFLKPWAPSMVAPDHGKLLEMLGAKRFDIAVLPQAILPFYTDQFQQAQFCTDPQVLFRKDAYIIINTKITGYKPRIQAAFQSWVRDGLWAREFERILSVKP